MVILFVAIFLFAGTSVLFSVVSIMRVRVHVARLAQTGEEGRFQWSVGNLFNYILNAIALTLLPFSIIFPDYLAVFLYISITTLGISIFFYHMINISMKEIIHYRELHSKEFASEQKWQNILDRYTQGDLHEILHRDSLEEMVMGDNREVRSRILAIDFHNHIASQGIADKEQEFRYLSRCINQAGTILYSRDCIIAQATGSGIVAVFDNDTLGAIDVATDINMQLKRMSKKTDDTESSTGPLANYTLLQGLVIIGLVSNGKALQPVIVSETLDLSYQVQRLARRLHIPMVIDEFSKRAYEKLDRHIFRYIGGMENKVSGQIIRTHEVLNLHSEEYKDQLMTTKNEFEGARRAQEQGEFRKAYSQYTSVIISDPHDLLAQYFQKQCRKVIESENADTQ